MDPRPQLDVARLAFRRVPLIRCLLVPALIVCWLLPLAARAEAADPQLERVKELFAAERWQDIVKLARSNPAPSPDLDFYYGSALAHLSRWEEARRVLGEGYRTRPGDGRFPVELAGVAFKQKRYREAASYLQRALKLAPQDSYANDFLGTVYFLQGNLAAAVKYWNRTGKPDIAQVRPDPIPKLDHVLLNRAFAFAPASTLHLEDLWTSEKRLDGLEIFPSYQMDLQAREDGKFDVVFRNHELNGWGPNKWTALFLLLRGLPAQTIYPEFFNFKGTGLNFTSMFRWDAQKRRIQANFSGPLSRNPGRHFSLGVDLREENWNLYPSFTGPEPLLGAFTLRREAIHASLASFVSGRWTWSAAAEVSHRDYRNIDLGTALSPALLPKGYELKQTTSFEAAILRMPERRLTLTSGASSGVGRVWSEPTHSFEKLQPSLRLRWFPQAQGDDYELQAQLRAGKTWGSLPFDELYALGIDADNDLWMRAHIATRDGRKGSAPLGRNYFLGNWEQDKKVYGNGLLTFKVGPFLDTGKITDPLPGLGSQEWLWDLGLQAKARVLGTEVVFSYGKDLRSGNNAFYVTLR